LVRKDVSLPSNQSGSLFLVANHSNPAPLFREDGERVMKKRIKSKLKGSRFERKVALELSKKGFLVYKGSASKGGWYEGHRIGVGDLLAINKERKLIIEVKYNKSKLTQKERSGLIEVARKVGAEPYLAYWEGEIKLERVKA